MILEVPVPLFNTGLVVSIAQSDAELELSLEELPWVEDRDKYRVLEALSREGQYNVTGRCYFDEELGACFIRVWDELSTSQNMGVMAHEIFHAAHHILASRGVTLSMESEETFAYLIEFITETVYATVVEQ